MIWSWYGYDMIMVILADLCSIFMTHCSPACDGWGRASVQSAMSLMPWSLGKFQLQKCFKVTFTVDNSILVGRNICYLMLFVLWRCSLKAIHWVTVPLAFNGIKCCHWMYCALVSRVPSRWAEKRASQDSFTTVAKDILSNNKDVVGLMAEGIQNLSQLHPELCDTTFVDNFLDQFLLNRIGSNVLLNQYLASIDKSLCNDR